MLFSSMIFLWVFLPITLLTYFILDKKYKNIFLLIASLIFYAWGEPKYIFLMMFSILINYSFGIWIDQASSSGRRKQILVGCIIINLGLLGYFKYFNFIIDNINQFLGGEVILAKNIILPIGISFYTFQALSYVVDVYRYKEGHGEVKVQKNILNLALYITLFPQLIAGPIVKYHDIESQIENRTVSVQRMAYGIKRFIYGLSKKVLISNTLALVSDQIFGLEISQIGFSTAWIGILCYSLQIYFDFAGYSDMAIGIGHMLGFRFMENFNYPYIAQSIQEFWRRWHISLSTWFREYLYIPLGGNRKGPLRTYVNLMIVFFATGLWHGASWNFIIWGLFHGVFLVLERKWLGKVLEQNKWKVLNHLYTLLIVMIGWVFFRANDLSHALSYLKQMFVPRGGGITYPLAQFLNVEAAITLGVGILLCGIVQCKNRKLKNALYNESRVYISEIMILPILMFWCILYLASGTYNPFIYFRF